MKHALVIEDSEDVVGWVNTYLGNEGWETTSVPSFSDGVKALRDSSYDLVIVDLNLPDSTPQKTREALPGIRALARCTPLLVMAEHTDLDTTLPECDAMLLKPFNGTDLRISVSQATDGKRQCMALPALAKLLSNGYGTHSAAVA